MSAGHVKQGLRRFYAALRARLSATLVDRRHGIETSAKVGLDELGLVDPDRVGYEPSGWRTLRRILRPGEVGAADSFIDFGSGKGRVVLEAARFPFRRVIGVELSQRLHEQSRLNLLATRESLVCQDVELVRADALAYDIPDDVTVVYLYNPFRGPTFRSVVRRVLESVDRHPRPLRLIYRTPLEHDFLVATGRFRLVRAVRGLRPTREWSRTSSISMYIVVPAATTSQ